MITEAARQIATKTRLVTGANERVLVRNTGRRATGSANLWSVPWGWSGRSSLDGRESGRPALRAVDQSSSIGQLMPGALASRVSVVSRAVAPVISARAT